MAKAYWVNVYHAIHDEEKLAAYAKIAGPAVQANGGKFLIRGMPAKAYEAGRLEDFYNFRLDWVWDDDRLPAFTQSPAMIHANLHWIPISVPQN